MTDYLPLVQRVCELIESSEGKRTLQDLSEQVHMSPFHLQRIFKRLMGVSPREYAEQKRRDQMKNHLQRGQDVTDALYAVGYGSSSRLYEKAGQDFGMTPATYQKGGKGMTIHYMMRDCELGKMMMARTDVGICAVNFGDTCEGLEQSLRDEFPHADRRRMDNDVILQEWCESLDAHLQGDFAHADILTLPLDVQGTAFQAKVWGILRTIPRGETRSYRQIAEQLGQPTASRAVARAIATNKIGVLIPCHRVIREDGAMSGYRWGVERKRRLLQTEH